MNFSQYMLVLRARYRIALLVLLVTVATTTVVTLIIPKTYIATVTLLVDTKDEQTLSNLTAPARAQIGYLPTQVDIITSQRVARKVVHDLKLTDSPVAQQNYQKDTGGKGSIDDWLAASLLKQLKVDYSSNSNSVQLMYSATDPKFAATIVNAFAKAYIETNLELRVEPARQATEWFEDQLKELRANLEDARDKLSTYQKDHGIVSSNESLDVENAKLSELSSQLVQAQGETYETLTRQKLGAAVVAKGQSLEDFPEVMSNPFIQTLKSQLLQGEAKLKTLSTQLGTNHPEYQRQVSENQSLREKLDQEMKKIVTGLGGSTVQSQQREAELRNAIAAQRSKVFDLKKNRDEVALLQGDVDAAQRAYDTAIQRSTINKVDSQANQTNVSILTPAVEPVDPSRPKVGLNITLSVIIGTMLGIATALLLEFADQRVRSAGDLAGESGVPVLVTLGLRHEPRENDSWFNKFLNRTTRLVMSS